MRAISDTLNFYEIQEKVEQYWVDKTPTKGSGWKQYKRWEYMMKPRVYPTGNPIDPTILWTEWQRVKQNLPQQKARGKSGQFELLGTNGNWTEIGPDVVPSNGGGIGRINCLEFDPLQPNILWAGTPDGGLWKSTNAGVGWTTNTDLLPNLGVADIAINPKNTNIMYIGTGDGYGLDFGGGTVWGGTYSMGVLKSTDGGMSWNSTGLNWSITQTSFVHTLIIHPDNPDTLLAATSNGIWKTTDGGVVWSMVRSGQFFDLEFKPGDPSTIYASGTDLYKSTDNGNNWTRKSYWSVGAINLAVTPANPNVVYALCDDLSSFYKSSNSANSFVSRPYPGINNVAGWYMLALAVSPTDENTVYAGGLDLAKSTNGGSSWATISDWSGWPAPNYTHADHRAITFYPGSSTTIYNGNDGGVFKSTNAGLSWLDLSDGLAISQFYKLGASQSDSGIIYAGAQDNGTARLSGGIWTDVGVGDGMECIVDHADNSIVYFSIYFGYLYKSTDGGENFIDIHLGSGDWVIPFIMDPVDPLTLYAGDFGGIYKTTDGGSSWGFISNGLSSYGYISTMEIAPSNSAVLYCSAGSKLFGGAIQFLKSTDSGNNWTIASSGLPIANNYITAIAVDDTDPSQLWVTVSGLDAGVKVFKSVNSGLSWSNISGALPNVSVNCITHAKDQFNGIYIGNDFGVYYKNDTIDDWVPFFDGLPNVIVSELEIQFAAGKIRAATYGRGLWESKVYSQVNGGPPPTAQFSSSSTQLCAGDSVVFTDQSINFASSWNWTFQGGTPANSTQQNNLVRYDSAGTYDVKLIVGNSGGSDTLKLSGYITVSPTPDSPVIIQNGDTLTTSTMANAYQWFLNGVPISGAYAQAYVVTTDGEYKLQVTNVEGCSAYSTTLAIGSSPNAQLAISGKDLCVGDSALFTDLSTGNPTQWSWVFTGGNPMSSSASDNTITYNDPGIFDVLLVAINSFGSDSLLLLDYITVQPLPSPPVIILFGSTLAIPALPGFYQWYLDDVVIQGAADPSHIPNEAGVYTVLYTDGNGCSIFSDPFLYGVVGVIEQHGEIWIRLFPNPNYGIMNLEMYLLKPSSITIQIRNILGQEVMQIAEEVPLGESNRQLDLSGLQPGVYFLLFSNGGSTLVERFVLEKH
ncbi:MAG: PKD domain-containing protein [Flavobacteriales bacterium]|nr:PKD domain-containing protein [Flavobacteriales bacterium]